jgi:predicted nuclease with TOPRIM domain
MGIFAERAVQAGEELVFNYNVDRYGADPQPRVIAESSQVASLGRIDKLALVQGHKVEVLDALLIRIRIARGKESRPGRIDLRICW